MATSPEDLQKQAEITNQIGEPGDNRTRTPEKKTQIIDQIGEKEDVARTAGFAGPGGMTFNVPRKRLQALIKKIPGLEDGRRVGPKKSFGSIDGIRTIIGASEGFMIPTNYRVRIQPPTGVSTEAGKVNLSSLEYDSLRRNRSLNGQDIVKENSANAALAQSPFGPFGFQGAAAGGQQSLEGTIQEIYRLATGGRSGFSMGFDLTETTLDMFCNQVQIPEKQISFGLHRRGGYGPPTPYPTQIQYGTMSTSFYSDGIMAIKKFFDTWQKLIYNDLTGNMNYYSEYIGSMEILTQKTVALQQGPSPGSSDKSDNFFQKLQKGVKKFTKSYEDFFRGDNENPIDGLDSQAPEVKTQVIDTYGVKVFECWPSIVGTIQMGHGMIDQIGKIDVTWAYRTWQTFGFGDVSARGGAIPMSIGQLRNEKDGFPFLEDLPPELGGPLTEGLTSGINSIPVGKMTGGRMVF